MKPLKKSKKVVSETLVQIKNGKMIRCSSRTKRPAGIYTKGRTTKMVGMDGKIKKIKVPEGLIFSGFATVKIASK